MIDYGRLGLAVRNEIIEFFRRYACINAVAALVDAAEALGGHVSPLTVRAFVFNPRITEALGDPQAPGAVERLQAAIASGGRDTVALGVQTSTPLPEGEWAGHLVGVVDGFKPARALVIDPTLEQANQPARGIVLRPGFLVVPPDVLGAVFRIRIEGCEIQYKAFPDDTHFLSTGAWRDRTQRDVLRDRVLNRLEREQP